MSTVNLTQALKSQILQRLEARFSDKLKETSDALQAQGELIYSSWVPPEKENTLLHLGPDYYIEGAGFIVKDPASALVELIALPTKRPFRSWRQHYAPSHRPVVESGGPVYVSCATFVPAPADACYEIVKETFARRTRYIKERDKLVSDMSALMGQCKNLKQLEQVWPSVVEFVPEEVLAKHRDSTKKQATKFDPSEVVMSNDTKVLLVKTLVTT